MRLLVSGKCEKLISPQNCDFILKSLDSQNTFSRATLLDLNCTFILCYILNWQLLLKCGFWGLWEQQWKVSGQNMDEMLFLFSRSRPAELCRIYSSSCSSCSLKTYKTLVHVVWTCCFLDESQSSMSTGFIGTICFLVDNWEFLILRSDKRKKEIFPLNTFNRTLTFMDTLGALAERAMISKWE